MQGAARPCLRCLLSPRTRCPPTPMCRTGHTALYSLRTANLSTRPPSTPPSSLLGPYGPFNCGNQQPPQPHHLNLEYPPPALLRRPAPSNNNCSPSQTSSNVQLLGLATTLAQLFTRLVTVPAIDPAPASPDSFTSANPAPSPFATTQQAAPPSPQAVVAPVPRPRVRRHAGTGHRACLNAGCHQEAQFLPCS